MSVPGREDVEIPGDAGVLHGLFELPDGASPAGGVVVAHPHPLHGGTMVQPLVHRIARACRAEGLATLRFNFRGVGRSAGDYSGVEEFRDVLSAVSWLRERLEGRPVTLCGYSFGAAMSALAAVEGAQIGRLALVAFPIHWEEMGPRFFARLGEVDVPVLALCGELDEIAPPAEVEAFLRSVGVEPHMVVIPRADHFFVGLTDQAAGQVARFATGADGPAALRDPGEVPHAV